MAFLTPLAGVYFELNVTNTSTIVVSLQNQKTQPKPTDISAKDAELQDRAAPPPGQQYSQYTFSAASRLRVSAPPVSLLALVDGEEYVVLPDATSLVPVRMKDMIKGKHHTIRVIAPMTDDEGTGVVQLDGIWLDKGGHLLPVEGSTASVGQTNVDDDLDPESDDVGRPHRLGLSSFLRSSRRDQVQAQSEDDDGEPPDFRRRKKLIEIVTDTPSHLDHRPRHTSRTREADNLLSGVIGWEYLIGEMFSVDHVCIGSEGMCLTHDCIGGTGSPSGMGDTFFRR